jgi:hypothetical protein
VKFERSLFIPGKEKTSPLPTQTDSLQEYTLYRKKCITCMETNSI